MENKIKLSETLQKYRADRPDEWTMDEFIRSAKTLEANENQVSISDEEISDKIEDYINKHGYKSHDLSLNNEYLSHSQVENLMEWMRDKLSENSKEEQKGLGEFTVQDWFQIDGKNHHVCITHSNGISKCFIDGELNKPKPFSGKIENIKTFGHHLSKEETITEYNKGNIKEEQKESWISVDKELPEHLVSVLVYIEEQHHRTTANLDTDGTWTLNYTGEEIVDSISHWQQLPNPPSK